MPDPFSLLQSPRSQGFAQGPQDPGDEESLFVQGFSDLAYKALTKSQPTLLADVVTFRVLEKDVQNGEAVGTFIVKRGDEILFVPVVLVDNAVKPLDLFYCRSRDRYYPLSSAWLREVMNSGVSQLGRALQPPKTLAQDVDIRHLTAPPIQGGRTSYASDESHLDGREVFTRMRRELGDGHLVLPQALSRLSDGTKVAVQGALQRTPKLAALLAEQYGVPLLREALRTAPRAKEASVGSERPLRRDVFLANAATPLQEFQRELEPGEVARAFGQSRSKGFYVRDLRAKHDDLFALAETSIALVEPKEQGLYRIYMAKGDAVTALVVPNPDSVHRDCSMSDRPSRGPGREHPRYLVIFPDGDAVILDRLLAEVVPADFGDLVAFVKKLAKDKPSGQEVGCLVSFRKLALHVTAPENASDVTTSGGRTVYHLGGCHTVVRVPGILGGVVKPPGQDTLMVGDDTLWMPVKRRYMREGDVLTDPRLIWSMIEAGAVKGGAEKVQVKKAMDGSFIIGPERAVAKGLPALAKVACRYGLHVADAASVLQAVQANAPVSLFVKKADGPPPGGAPPGGAPPGGDPSMGGQMPGVPQAPPPPPSGIELAVAEKTQLIQAQIAALQQQMQMLAEVGQRASMIDQGGGAMAAPTGATGAMGAPPAGVGGGPAMAPTGGDPNAMQQGAPPAGAPPGGPPPGGAPPGGDPNAMPQGGAPPGGDPNAPPPPPPVMPDSPSPDTIAQQISPAFLQDAKLLGDPQIFDAAAVATFAKSKALREIFQNYAPTLDNAVDKLGRALLLLYTQTREIREQIGDEGHKQLEEKVRDVFRSLGEAVILLEQYGDQLSPEGQPAV